MVYRGRLTSYLPALAWAGALLAALHGAFADSITRVSLWRRYDS